MESNLEYSLEQLRGAYDFIKLLGAGNFSRVFLVRHKFLQKDLTLKILDVKGISQVLKREGKANIHFELDKIKNGFINEAKIIKDIKHPNIVEVDDIGVVNEREENVELPYFTMKFVKGITLKDRINSDKALSMESILRISEDILSALKAIHERDIIYRDIKPRNIIIEEKTGRAILVNLNAPKDFLNEILLIDARASADVSPYMPPEQIRFGKSKIGPFTDIYSFGVVLYEMITRELPFKGISYKELFHQHSNAPIPNIRKNNSNLPVEIETIIDRAMAKEPSRRFQDTGTLKKAFEDLVKKSELYDRDLYEVMMELGNAYEVIDAVEKKVGFSKVYRLKHRGLDSQQVLKIMKYGDFSGKDEKELEDFRGKFLEEGRLLAKIKHENIVRIYDLGITWPSKIPYSVREYVEGKRLDDLIKEKAPFSFDEALKIAGEILPALGKLHNNPSPIIHKDIKPSNIIIEKETNNAILIDFGIAKDKLSELTLTPSGAYLGTPEYMSPEQCNGMKNLDTATDIYSFGVVLYEMLSGEVPFKNEERPLDVMYDHSHSPVPDIRGKNCDLPPGIEAIISKAMAKEPVERYKNTGEFLHALKELKEVHKLKDKRWIAENHQEEKVIEQVKYRKNKKQDRIHKRHYSFRYLILIPFLALLALAVFTLNPFGKIKEHPMSQDKLQSTPGNGTKRSTVAENQNNAQKIIPAKNDTQDHSDIDPSKPIHIKGDIDEVIQFIEGKAELNLDKYLELKKKSPNLHQIMILKERLISGDKNLPPEKYWAMVKRNQKGYYELTFDVAYNEHHMMIYIPREKIWIDKYEVSWAQFRKFLLEKKINVSTKKDRKFINSDDKFPVVVTYEEAEKYCKRYGFRLPTEDEWEYAAGQGKFIYPWGNELPDENGVWHANFESFEDGFEGTAPVKSFERFSSPHGVVNMSGNVWEWVQGNIFKGGGFFSDKEDLTIKNKNVGKSKIKKGFRCIRDENLEKKDNWL
jgi:serine/threonine protein kinase